MTQIDVVKLANLAWLHIDGDDTKLTQSINNIIWYMELMDWFDLVANDISDQKTAQLQNSSDRNSWTTDFDAKDQILQNSNHLKINNSIVLTFAN